MPGPFSRRSFLATTGGALLAPRFAGSAAGAKRIPTMLDHILVGSNHLERGIAYLEQRIGVRAKFGGVHPGAGTQNALLSLGPNRYLEIIAPDPHQPAGLDSRDLKSLNAEPSVVGWAAHHPDIDALASRLTQQGFALQGPMPGSRKRPDGRVLTWKVLRLKSDPTDLLPFFIEWSSDSIHPSVDSPQGCRLLRFEASATHEDAQLLAGQIQALGLDLPLGEGDRSLLIAAIEGPRGQLQLTS